VLNVTHTGVHSHTTERVRGRRKEKRALSLSCALSLSSSFPSGPSDWIASFCLFVSILSLLSLCILWEGKEGLCASACQQVIGKLWRLPPLPLFLYLPPFFSPSGIVLPSTRRIESSETLWPESRTYTTFVYLSSAFSRAFSAPIVCFVSFVKKRMENFFYLSLFLLNVRCLLLLSF